MTTIHGDNQGTTEVQEGPTKDAEGSRSLGFNTYVFPHTFAKGNIHRGIMAGKLNGVMPAHTPKGCRHNHTRANQAEMKGQRKQTAVSHLTV